MAWLCNSEATVCGSMGTSSLWPFSPFGLQVTEASTNQPEVDTKSHFWGGPRSTRNLPALP